MSSPPSTQGSFATTLDYSDDMRWRQRTHLIPPPLNVLDQIRVFVQLVRHRHATALLLDSRLPPLHPELFAAVLLRMLPGRRRATLLMGAMWQKDPGWRGALQTLLVRLADPAIDLYAVQSSEELTLFPETWGVDRSKLRLCLFYAPFTASRPDRHSFPSEGHIFAGGNSHRDYANFIQAAGRFPQSQFIIATTRSVDQGSLPPNVKLGPVGHAEYQQLLATSVTVVIPMMKGMNRAAGQATYLNAMYLGKPVIVSDSPGVHDHIDHGRTGLIVDGSVASYTSALNWLMDPANKNEVALLGATAQATAREQFTFERHATRLLEIIDEAIRGRESA